MQAAPAPSYGQTGGLTREERIEALFSQYGDMERAVQLADEQIAYEGGTPSPLAGQGVGEPIPVEIDQGVYQPGLDTNESYLDAIKRGTPSAAPGYQTARQQEELRSKLMRDRGLGMTMADQFTAPLNDEMAGAVGYLSQGAGNLGRRLMGRDIEVSAAQRAQAATDVARNDQARFSRENPVQSFVGQTLGGFAFAPARVAGVAQGAQNFLRTSGAFMQPSRAANYAAAGATGVGYGAADAEGGAIDRLLGGGIGGAVSLATAGAFDAGQAGVRGLMGRSNLRGPERRVSDVINRELRANRVDPNDLLASLNSAPAGSLPFNAQDGVLAPVAEALVATTGPGGRIVRQAVDAQRGAAPDRIMSRIGSEVGGEGNYFATLNNSIEQRRQAAGQVIDQIGPQQFRLNDNTVRALRSDLAQPQLRQAAQNALASPDQATYEMGANIMRLADTLRDNPSAAVLDVRTAQDVSRALLDMSSDAWRQGNGSTGNALGGIGRALRNNAREAVPEYGQWLSRYGDESSQIEALELGRRVFRNADDPAADGMSAEVLRGRFAEMSDTAKDMFRKGIAEAIVARARTSRGEVGAMRDLLRTQEFGDRVRLAFPDEQAFTRFMNAAEAEVAMANAGQGIIGNSSTARRQATMQRLGGQPEQRAADTLGSITWTGAPLVAGRAAIRAGGRALGRQNSVLENDRLNELLGRAVSQEDVLRLMLQRGGRRVGLFGGGRAPVGAIGSGRSAVAE